MNVYHIEITVNDRKLVMDVKADSLASITTGEKQGDKFAENHKVLINVSERGPEPVLWLLAMGKTENGFAVTHEDFLVQTSREVKSLNDAGSLPATFSVVARPSEKVLRCLEKAHIMACCIFDNTRCCGGCCGDGHGGGCCP